MNSSVNRCVREFVFNGLTSEWGGSREEKKGKKLFKIQ